MKDSKKIFDVPVSESDKSPYKYYDRIFTLIEDIKEVHIAFCKDIKELLNLNLKRTKVAHMFLEEQRCVIAEEYYKWILSYIEKVNELTVYLEFDFLYGDLDLSMRVKQRESIAAKLTHYRYGKTEQGKVPINKCLNDLLGIRIIIDGFDHTCKLFSELCEGIKKQKNYKIKIEDASKNGYVATHIYFQGEDNFAFPWELQIWSKKDDSNNKTSHNEHKQSYTKWAGQYKESTEIEKEGGI